MAMNTSGSRIYTANGNSNDVSVLDTASNAVIATIPIGGSCTQSCIHGVKVNAAGDRLYIGGGSVTYPESLSAVHVIDLTTNTVIASIDVGLGANDLEVTPDGTRVYVGSHWVNTVTVIDTATNTVLTTIPGGYRQMGMAMQPAGNRIYSSNHWGGSISVIDMATNVEITQIPVNTPMGIAVINADLTTYSLSGNIRQKTGGGSSIPLSGVAVTLSGSRAGNTTTDLNGDYSFNSLMSCSYDVTPSLAGYTFSPQTRKTSIAGADAIDVNFNARQ
jgi:YVTN family beta-propeller protein